MDNLVHLLLNYNLYVGIGGGIATFSGVWRKFHKPKRLSPGNEINENQKSLNSAVEQLTALKVIIEALNIKENQYKIRIDELETEVIRLYRQAESKDQEVKNLLNKVANLEAELSLAKLQLLNKDI